MNKNPTEPKRSVPGRILVGLMCVGLLTILLGPNGSLFSLLSFGILVPLCWLQMEWRAKRWRAAVIGLLSLAYAYFLGLCSVVHQRSHETSILIRALQQSQEYLRRGDPEGLAAELARSQKALGSGRTPHDVLLDFRGPIEVEGQREIPEHEPALRGLTH